MKIPGPADLQLRLAAAEAARRAARYGAPVPAGAAGEETTGPDSDSVRLSERARELARLAEEIGRLPDVRRELVDRFREEIAEGRYVVDTRRIADELLGEIDLARPRAGAPSAP
ncbi:MAG: hypothetical protein Kow0062_01000 [Acidobacteriota bacterium]|nr:MAG: flagellar biosynthesis anti-sigma factor FlgM [Acidobacteriota bacterium]